MKSRVDCKGQQVTNRQAGSKAGSWSENTGNRVVRNSAKSGLFWGNCLGKHILEWSASHLPHFTKNLSSDHDHVLPFGPPHFLTPLHSVIRTSIVALRSCIAIQGMTQPSPLYHTVQSLPLQTQRRRSQQMTVWSVLPPLSVIGIWHRQRLVQEAFTRLLLTITCIHRVIPRVIRFPM